MQKNVDFDIDNDFYNRKSKNKNTEELDCTILKCFCITTLEDRIQTKRKHLQHSKKLSPEYRTVPVN